MVAGDSTAPALPLDNLYWIPLSLKDLDLFPILNPGWYREQGSVSVSRLICAGLESCRWPRWWGDCPQLGETWGWWASCRRAALLPTNHRLKGCVCWITLLSVYLSRHKASLLLASLLDFHSKARRTATLEGARAKIFAGAQWPSILPFWCFACCLYRALTSGHALSNEAKGKIVSFQFPARVHFTQCEPRLDWHCKSVLQQQTVGPCPLSTLLPKPHRNALNSRILFWS